MTTAFLFATLLVIIYFLEFFSLMMQDYTSTKAFDCKNVGKKPSLFHIH